MFYPTWRILWPGFELPVTVFLVKIFQFFLGLFERIFSWRTSSKKRAKNWGKTILRRKHFVLEFLRRIRLWKDLNRNGLSMIYWLKWNKNSSNFITWISKHWLKRPNIYFFMKKWAKPGLFFFIFVLFSTQCQIHHKRRCGVLGIRTQDRRMVGADKSTELWLPLKHSSKWQLKALCKICQIWLPEQFKTRVRIATEIWE